MSRQSRELLWRRLGTGRSQMVTLAGAWWWAWPGRVLGTRPGGGEKGEGQQRGLGGLCQVTSNGTGSHTLRSAGVAEQWLRGDEREPVLRDTCSEGIMEASLRHLQFASGVRAQGRDQK